MIEVKWSSLGEVADFRAGFGFPPNLQGRETGDYPFAKVGDISKVARAGFPSIGSAVHNVDDSDLYTLKAKVLPAESIVFAKIGEAIRQNFRAITSCPMLIDNNVMGMVPDKSKVDPWYLYYFMRTIDLYCLTDSTTVPALRKSKLETISIPLPPLPEQKRIAAILDKADSIRRKRQEAVRLTEELLRSVFLDMFGDPVANPKGWETKSFEDLLEFPLRNGLSPSTGGQYPGKVLTLSAITGSYFDANAIKFAVFSQELPPDKLVNTRDFLICRGNGNADLVRKGKFPLIEIGNTLFPDTMIAARIAQGKVVPEFLEMVWHTQLVRGQIDKGARTTNGTYKVNQSVLNAVKILCPPIEIQTKFAITVKSAVRMQIKNSNSLIGSETLFNSLLQRAFKGEDIKWS